VRAALHVGLLALRRREVLVGLEVAGAPDVRSAYADHVP